MAVAAGEDPCADLLQVVEGDEHFTTRAADKIIHTHTGYGSMTTAQKIEHHKDIQREILNRFAGCEKAIFNDPTVKYNIRKHFEGPTGTMSNILTSGYFTLYERLLNSRLGITVNALDDYITLFYLASSLTVRDGAFVMDPIEFLSMTQILTRLKSMLPPEITLFTNEWFREYREFLEAVHTEALENYTYYRNNPINQTLNQAIGWKGPRLPELQKEELQAKHFLGSFTHTLYEYYPPYMNPFFRDDLLTNYLQKLPALEQLFTIPSRARQVDVLSKKPRSSKPPSKSANTGRKSTKRHRKGGAQTLTFKRKGNTLSGQRRVREILK